MISDGLPDGFFFEELKQKKDKTEFDKYFIKEYEKIRKVIIGLVISIFVIMIIAFLLK